MMLTEGDINVNMNISCRLWATPSHVRPASGDLKNLQGVESAVRHASVLAMSAGSSLISLHKPCMLISVWKHMETLGYQDCLELQSSSNNRITDNALLISLVLLYYFMHASTSCCETLAT